MVTLIRHAESTFNARRELTRDCPITDKGRRQAHDLVGTYDCIICSTMRRTRQTLDASRLVYAEVIFTNLCREIMDGNPVNLYSGETHRVETSAQVKTRVTQFKQFLKTIQSKYPRVAVISHRGFLYQLCKVELNNAAQLLYTIN
jgi:broad specificity phosphatase PhoE